MAHGINKNTDSLLFNGITMMMAREQGYTIKDTALVAKLHERLITKYNSMTQEERAMLRSQAEKKIQQVLDKLTKQNLEKAKAKNEEASTNSDAPSEQSNSENVSDS